MKKISLILLLFLMGCTQQPFENINESIITRDSIEPVIDLNNETSKIVNNTTVKDVVVEDLAPKEFPVRNFTIEDLKQKIIEVEGIESNFREDNRSLQILEEIREKGEVVHTSNFEMKNWVIHIVNEPINNIQDFYDYVRTPKWKMWRYYINETAWGWLYPEIDEDELKKILPYYNYKEYIKIPVLDLDIYENTEKLSYGDIIRFRQDMHLYGQFGYWQGNWEPSLVIYKIPCTKNIVVYHRPRWRIGFGYTGHANQKRESAKKNWARDLALELPNMDTIAGEIMDFCGVKKAMFNGYSPAYEKHQRLVNSWKVYFRMVFNYTFDADIKAKTYGEKFKIDTVDITFTPLDPNDFMKKSYLSVKMWINDSGKIEEYHDFFVKGGKMSVGESVIKHIEKETPRPFKANATMIFQPYIGWEDLGSAYSYDIGPKLTYKIPT